MDSGGSYNFEVDSFGDELTSPSVASSKKQPDYAFSYEDIFRTIQGDVRNFLLSFKYTNQAILSLKILEKGLLNDVQIVHSKIEPISKLAKKVFISNDGRVKLQGAREDAVEFIQSIPSKLLPDQRFDSIDGFFRKIKSQALSKFKDFEKRLKRIAPKDNRAKRVIKETKGDITKLTGHLQNFFYFVGLILREESPRKISRRIWRLYEKEFKNISNLAGSTESGISSYVEAQLADILRKEEEFRRGVKEDATRVYDSSDSIVGELKIIIGPTSFAGLEKLNRKEQERKRSQKVSDVHVDIEPGPFLNSQGLKKELEVAVHSIDRMMRTFAKYSLNLQKHLQLKPKEMAGYFVAENYGELSITLGKAHDILTKAAGVFKYKISYEKEDKFENMLKLAPEWVKGMTSIKRLLMNSRYCKEVLEENKQKSFPHYKELSRTMHEPITRYIIDLTLKVVAQTHGGPVKAWAITTKNSIKEMRAQWDTYEKMNTIKERVDV